MWKTDAESTTVGQPSRMGAVGKEESEGIGEKLVGEIKNLIWLL